MRKTRLFIHTFNHFLPVTVFSSDRSSYSESISASGGLMQGSRLFIHTFNHFRPVTIFKGVNIGMKRCYIYEFLSDPIKQGYKKLHGVLI